MQKFLGNAGSMPLLGEFQCVYPLAGNFAERVPGTPLLRPLCGETRYFALHGCKNLVVEGTVYQQANCCGNFCDGQSTILPLASDPDVSCGCISGRDTSRYILKHNLKIECGSDVSTSGSLVVANFCSFHFDDLMLDRTCDRAFEQVDNDCNVANNVLRQHVRAVVHHVNSRSGWTIIGWLRTGKEMIGLENWAEQEVLPHVALLTPTSSNDCAEDACFSNSLERLRLSETTFMSRVRQMTSA